MTDPLRIKRLRIRSWRRGIKEMDLILGRWSDEMLGGMSDADLDLYEALLEENDHDLYQWVTGQAEPPLTLAPLIRRIADQIGAALKGAQPGQV